MANEIRLIDANRITYQVAYLPTTQGAEKVWVATEQDIENVLTIDPESLRPKGRWEWFEEWLPSTTEHPRECLDCGWRCSECKNALEDMVGGYWDNPDEKPDLNYCPNCGMKMER